MGESWRPCRPFWCQDTPLAFGHFCVSGFSQAHTSWQWALLSLRAQNPRVWAAVFLLGWTKGQLWRLKLELCRADWFSSCRRNCSPHPFCGETEASGRWWFSCVLSFCRCWSSGSPTRWIQIATQLWSQHPGDHVGSSSGVLWHHANCDERLPWPETLHALWPVQHLELNNSTSWWSDPGNQFDLLRGRHLAGTARGP